MNLDFSTLAGAQDFLWQGFKYSLTLTVSSMVFGIFFGTLLAMARQGLCFIPAVWLLEHAFGLLGVQLAQPVADFLSFLLAIPLTLPVLRGLRDSEAAKKVSKP